MSHPGKVTPPWRVWGLAAVLLAGIGYWVRHRPYARPLTYRIGAVDPRFHLDREALSAAARDAAALWNRATVRELLRYDPQGEVELRLEYDERQSASDRLNSLGRNLEQRGQEFQELEAQAQNLKSDLETRTRQLEEAGAAYQTRAESLKSRMDTARRGLGLSEFEAKSLQADQEELRATWQALEQRRSDLSEARKDFNQRVAILNDLAASHNQEAAGFNAAGSRLEQEFCGGEYVKEGTRQTITVYFMGSRNGLVRVLAHEFGHALGLPHLPQPEAVMHALTTRDEPALTASDLQAIRERVEGPR